MRRWLQFLLLLLAATAFARVPALAALSPPTPTHHRLAEVEGHDPARYGYDDHATTRSPTAKHGATTNTYTYDAIGNSIAPTPTLGSQRSTGGRFCRERYDTDLGLDHRRARHPNLHPGRFRTMDAYERNSTDPLSLRKYLYGADDPVNMVDPTGLFGIFKFTRNFGYAAHAAIESAYQAGNPGAIVGPTPGILGPLKPDIFNPIKKTYGEIKPLSLSGVAAGIAQMAAYEAMYGVNGDPGITGLRFNHKAWPDGVRGAYVGQIPIAYWNVAGLIFYTDMVDNTEDLLALTTYAAVRQFIIANSAMMGRTLVGAMPRIAVLANSRVPIDTARLQMHVGIATLLGLLGAP